jgi:hypothetical protein
MSWYIIDKCNKELSIDEAFVPLQVRFEESLKDESSMALLSVLLSQNLGVDCTRIKTPEYTAGYLLGDHKVCGMGIG